MRRDLYFTAEFGAPDVLAELVAETDDVDRERSGRTALWHAVFGNRPENVRVLLDAGADPHRPMMSGWTPGRLSLAGPHPLPGDHEPLTPAETDAVAQARGLLAVLDGPNYEGIGLACVADVNAAEAARRLDAEETEQPTDYDPWSSDDSALYVVGVADVPGGCVVTQPWAYAPTMPGVMNRLSPGTDCYGLFMNAKSGRQGSVSSDGVFVVNDLNPGGSPDEDEPPDKVLAAYLYQRNAVAYACAFVGLRPSDSGVILYSPDRWLRLPRLDYWPPANGSS